MRELIKNQPKQRFSRMVAGVGILFGGLQLFPAQRVNPTVPADFIALACRARGASTPASCSLL